MKKCKKVPKKEIKENLEKVLREIGTIKPWFDNSVNEWIFCHPDYPVEYGGKTALDVIRNYPKYLQEFIKQRLDGKLNPLTEQKTTGHGGKRIGAGHPTGSTKEIRQWFDERLLKPCRTSIFDWKWIPIEKDK